jgi:molybdate transport system substrate-binding protein
VQGSKPRPIVLFNGLATVKALESGVLDAFTESTGIEVERHYDPTTELQRRMEAGEQPDLLIAATHAIPGIAETCAIDATTSVPLVTTAIGLGVRAGDPHPAIATLDEMQQALLEARSVAYSRAGQSGIYFRSLLDRLGIADEVNAKATVLPKGFTGEALVDGRASLAVQQLSELAYVDGVEIVGPLPAEVQHVTEFSAALGSRDDLHEGAARLQEFLRGERAREAYLATGLESVD